MKMNDLQTEILQTAACKDGKTRIIHTGVSQAIQ
jgi:hypothetical protein